MKMLNPNPLMLVRIAQGDAYCMSTEYVRPHDRPELIKAAKSFQGYLKHPVHRLDAGKYTDDTQMSIAVAEHLLSTDPTTKLNLAERFVVAFMRDKREGYSRGFQGILENASNGQDLLDRLIPTSTKNGAAMRSVPLGVIQDMGELIFTATTQASVTHQSEAGILSSIFIAMISHFALYTNMNFRDIMGKIADTRGCRDILLERWVGPVTDRSQRGGHDVGLNTVQAVCTLLREEKTMLGILERTIDWGGDTDSVAAIALGIASCRMREPLPAFFDEGLEPGGKFGHAFLFDLGTRLMKKYDA